MLMNYGMSQMIDIESFSWPAEVPPMAFVYATLGCILAVYLSNLTSMKTIKHLSLVEVLKERE
jgi:ABC-type antimicrobial peptide transport system permease subunit